MEKTIIQKLYKNPDRFLYDENFYAYLYDLECKGLLHTLPENLYVYYVLSILFGEINNGGFVQYIQNSCGSTYGDIAPCAKIFGLESLVQLIADYKSAVDSFLLVSGQTLEHFNPDGDLQKRLDELDDRFVDIDGKEDLDKKLLRYYKDNFTVNIIKYTAVKEAISDECNYFTIPSDMKARDVYDAMDSFLRVLADFPDFRWHMELRTFFDGDYSIRAHSVGKAIDLHTVILKWGDNSFSFSGKQSSAYTERMKVSSYFRNFTILSRTDGEHLYGIKAAPSGFEPDEMKIKLKLLEPDITEGKVFSEIISGMLSHNEDPGRYAVIRDYLKSQLCRYENIESLSETVRQETGHLHC